MDIFYQGHPEWTRIVNKSTETLTDQEGAYMVRADPTDKNIVEIPTTDCFSVSTIMDAFMVNLVLDKDNPTHENRTLPGDEMGRMYLHCRRDMGGRPGKPIEVSVDYHYELSRVDKTRRNNSSDAFLRKHLPLHTNPHVRVESPVCRKKKRKHKRNPLGGHNYS